MLFAGWEVHIVKNCDQGLEKAEGSIFKTLVTVFHYTDRPKPVNNLFIFFPLSQTTLFTHGEKLMQALLWPWSEIGKSGPR